MRYLPYKVLPLAILCRLEHAPLHGYAIAQLLYGHKGESFRDFTARVYMACKRLHRTGYIHLSHLEPSRYSTEQRKVYTLTLLGREALREAQIMMGVISGSLERRNTAMPCDGEAVAGKNLPRP